MLELELTIDYDNEKIAKAVFEAVKPDKESLYKNMVAAGADWLYNLPQWNDIYDEDKRKELYRIQKLSTTVVKEAKIYPNDPCPCGSGKKYKKCCGRK